MKNYINFIFLISERLAHEREEERKARELENKVKDDERQRKRQEEQDMIANLEKMIMLRKSME